MSRRRGTIHCSGIVLGMLAAMGLMSAAMATDAMPSSIASDRLAAGPSDGSAGGHGAPRHRRS